MSLLLDALKGAEDSRKATGQDAGEPVDVIDSKVELEFSLELDQVDDQDQVVEVKGIESEEINNEKNIHSDSGVGNMPELHKVGMPEGGSDDFGNKIQNEANSDEGGVEKNKITDEHNIAEAAVSYTHLTLPTNSR
ncbi:MAG: hypothetical protein KUG81_04425, partial [Gammaproteobacteria bacterium]|nr:hypothetical protein [Gammaproteobacteria bacterium]